MIRADVLVSAPVYFVGLVQTFIGTGIKVVSVRYTPEDDPSWLADIALVDAAALPPVNGIDQVALATRFTAVLVIHDDLVDPGIYLGVGALGVISRQETAQQMVNAVQQVAAGKRVGCGTAAQPIAEQAEQLSHSGLSERENQVLDQISHGLTHGQVATRLGISPHTVDTYVKRIRAKLGVTNKAELTRAALLARHAG